METQEFIYLQKKQLKAKKYYYIFNEHIMTDYQFDMLEKQSISLAIKLGLEDIEDHVHNMIGYKEGNKYENMECPLWDLIEKN